MKLFIGSGITSRRGDPFLTASRSSRLRVEELLYKIQPGTATRHGRGPATETKSGGEGVLVAARGLISQSITEAQERPEGV